MELYLELRNIMENIHGSMKDSQFGMTASGADSSTGCLDMFNELVRHRNGML